MTPSPQPSPDQRRALKISATIVAGIIVLVFTLWARSGGDSGTSVATQSIIGVPNLQGSEVAETTPPLMVPTTAPLTVPTATPIPTATSEPTATATSAPTATAVPTPEPRLDPTPAPAVEVASAEATAQSDPPLATSTPAPEPTVEPTPEVEDTAEPTPEVEDTAEPTPQVEDTAEPTPEPTAPETEPTVDPQAEPSPTVEPTPEPTSTPVPVQTVADLEAYVLGEINQVRANAGLGPLQLDANISLISRDWSQQMAVGGFFQHRPGPELDVMLPSGWRRWGENIASAPDIQYAQSSLEASPGHYANMVGPFSHVGIGVFTNGSQVWLTQNFALYE